VKCLTTTSKLFDVCVTQSQRLEEIRFVYFSDFAEQRGNLASMNDLLVLF